MCPVITLFGLSVGSYRLFSVLAAAAGALLVWRPLRRAGMTRLRSALLLLGMCAAFLVGARLWNVAVNPENFRGALHWYTPRLAGLSLFGGILGAMAVLLLALRIQKRSPWRILDGFTIPSGIAFCIARIGCFLNGCCKGIRTDSALGIVFPSKSGPIKLGPLGSFSMSYPVHPTQLYELFGAAIGLPLCILLTRRWKLPDGGAFLLYGIWFCAVRLAVLPLRALNYPNRIQTLFYPLLYAVCIAAGVLLLLYRRKKKSPA